MLKQCVLSCMCAYIKTEQKAKLLTDWLNNSAKYLQGPRELNKYLGYFFSLVKS